MTNTTIATVLNLLIQEMIEEENGVSSIVEDSVSLILTEFYGEDAVNRYRKLVEYGEDRLWIDLDDEYPTVISVLNYIKGK